MRMRKGDRGRLQLIRNGIAVGLDSESRATIGGSVTMDSQWRRSRTRLGESSDDSRVERKWTERLQWILGRTRLGESSDNGQDITQTA